MESASSAIQTFAAELRAAIAATTTRRDGKVLLVEVWRKHFSEAPLEAFKAGVFVAHQHRMVSLSRCDMPQLHRLEDVQASEITHFTATFHFVQV